MAPDFVYEIADVEIVAWERRNDTPVTRSYGDQVIKVYAKAPSSRRKDNHTVIQWEEALIHWLDSQL